MTPLLYILFGLVALLLILEGLQLVTGQSTKLEVNGWPLIVVLIGMALCTAYVIGQWGVLTLLANLR